MSTTVNSLTRPVQTFQTQNTGFVQPAAQQANQLPALDVLNKAIQLLEQAVAALSQKGFNNKQSVASQALGGSGPSQGNPFDFASFKQDRFDPPAQQTQFQPQFLPQPAPEPVQTTAAHGNNLHDTLDAKGGGNGHPELNYGHTKSGGGTRPGSDSAGF